MFTSGRAHTSLRDALSVAQSIRVCSIMLESVVGFARLHLYEGHFPCAEELTGLARGKNLDLEQAVYELLGNF